MRALALALVLCAAPGAAQEFEVAHQPRIWSFPTDHGAHLGFGTEWWYFTGSVRNEAGERYGFELTFFRVAMRPDEVISDSPWRARDLVLGHLAVTDVAHDAFHHEEVMQRAAAGLAGAREDRLHVWAGDWSVEQVGESFRLRAVADGPGLDLTLTGGEPILHGDDGLSRKNADGSAASHYYSMPRLVTTGTLRVGSREMAVEGMTWMDHEFFTGITPAEGIGWDWFSVRLDDGRSLMLYAVRHLDGERYRFGTLIEADGGSRPLDLEGLQTEALEHWTSPVTEARYPIAWRIVLPAEKVTLQARATVAEQEIFAERSVGFAYWEGLTDYRGEIDGEAVRGEGYVELTGY